MTLKSRRQHSASLKAKVVLESVRGERTVAELAQNYGVHPTQMANWKRRLLDGAAEVFGAVPAPTAVLAVLKGLHAKIAQFTLGKDFLQGVQSKAELFSVGRESTAVILYRSLFKHSLCVSVSARSIAAARRLRCQKIADAQLGCFACCSPALQARAC